MNRILLIIVFALLNIGLIQAQDSTPTATTETSTPAQTETTANSCDPANINWCFAGEPWGDGRCDDPDPDVTAYNYLQGFYRAAEECGIISESDAPSASFADDDGAFSFSCRAVQHGDNEVNLSANWSRRIQTQARVVFRFDIEFVDLGWDTNNGETVSIGSFDTSISATREYRDAFVPIDLKSATAYLIDGLDNPLTSPVDCAIGN